MAVGVASPSAQGHEITSTDIPIESAKLTPLPRISQTIVVITAIAITVAACYNNLRCHKHEQLKVFPVVKQEAIVDADCEKG